MKYYNTIIGAILVFCAALAAAGTALYYAVGFGWMSMGVAILVAATAIYLIIARSTPKADDEAIQSGLLRSHRSLAMTNLTILSLDLIALAALVIYRTTDAIRSPWEVVPPIYFILFWTASLLLLLMSRKSSLTLPLAALHTFTGWSVALLVYQIGFGFDPFIHQAAEKIIAADGVVRPLTPYYIGQYVIVVTLHRLTTIPLDVLDRWLLPVLASIAVPYALSRMRTSLAALATLIPATTFIMTTPQGLGNLWLLLTAFSLPSLRGVSKTNDKAIQENETGLLRPRSLPRAATRGSLAMTGVFALAALATHPIAGIPAIGLVLIALPLRVRGSWRGLVFLLTSLSLPAAFALQHFATIRPHFPSFDLARLLPLIQNHYDWPLDFVYLVGKNVWIIIIAFAILSVITRSRATKQSQTDAHLLTAAALFVSYLLVTTLLDFGGLIGYETTIFPRRLLEVAAIVLLPLVAKGLDIILCHSEEPRVEARDKLRDEESPWRSFTAFRMTGALFLASTMTASIYLTYPRVDKYDKSSGYSVSAAMVQAVHWIESDRAGRAAVVLADQNAAAVQIHDYGFGPYYPPPVILPSPVILSETKDLQTPNYFYSHPSGGLGLYRYYLRIMDDREDPLLIAREAMAYAGVTELYLVVPTYWKGAKRVIGTTLGRYASSFSTADGTVYVFHFRR